MDYKKPIINIFCSNKGGSGKTLFSLVSMLHGYFNGARVAAIDLNFQNPDTATILQGLIVDPHAGEAPIINEGTTLAYREEFINDRLVSIRPHPLYHKEYQVLTFLDQFLFTNEGRFDLIVVDTGLNLPNLMPAELDGEKWPRSRPVPTIWQLYTYSAGLRPWEMEAYDETVAMFRQFFHPEFDARNLIHVFNPQAFIPNSLNDNVKYAIWAQYKFDGADQMIKRLQKAGKKDLYAAIDWDTFRKEILLEVRSEFWRQPLGEYWKDEIPAIFLVVANNFLKAHNIVPTNIFFHPYVYHRVQMLVDDLLIRRGKSLESIKDLIEPVYDNFVDFLSIKEHGIAAPLLGKEPVDVEESQTSLTSAGETG
ncbi:MAG TPA: hypothetical protein VKM55_12735 [Candidatus Lokiarchaeia archaeon]|nr:hypothetical protein [Candidatus Lokiarchaeia archaeon]